MMDIKKQSLLFLYNQNDFSRIASSLRNNNIFTRHKMGVLLPCRKAILPVALKKPSIIKKEEVNG
ncbi:hypothetical protein [Endozoicomonas sp. SCSIO W0465]|uniref:hypothetical protein n=1 Tax=Endozoicomonas sp. SCSIO W0465 TaxID=2918516 RepID=UPI002075E6C1|nr:hypothetical protein [Endozoicomonas sp. SCSIO W0465]USE38139.1 hypothetical protein MJO57_08210 [Endozoicomonas sp. SCSIO W0465]